MWTVDGQDHLVKRFNPEDWNVDLFQMLSVQREFVNLAISLSMLMFEISSKNRLSTYVTAVSRQIGKDQG